LGLKFRAGASELDAASEEPLRSAYDTMARLLERHPECRFELRGHADSGEHDAKALSEARARAVWARLIEMGIPEDTMRLTASVTKLYRSQPISEKNRREIRRVSIRVVNPPPKEPSGRRPLRFP
jgi:outer membrane protein OmpA-like peptidoglycan-associated protein